MQKDGSGKVSRIPELLLRTAVWALPVAAVAAAAAISYALVPWGGSTIPYGMFFLAVAVTALLAGFWRAFAASFLSLFTISWLFLEPAGSLRIGHAGDRAGAILFLLTCLVISALSYAIQESRRRAEQLAARQRATFDNAGVGIVEVEGHDRFVAVNDRACAILGYSREQLLRMNVHELTWPEDRALSDRLNREVHEGPRNAVEYEKRYLRGDGSPVWAHVTIRAIRDAAGNWQRSITTIEDINDRKRAQDELRKREATLSAVLDALPIGVVIADSSGKILRDNAAHRELWGAAPETDSWQQYGAYVGYWPESGQRIMAEEWAMARALLRGEVVKGELVECERFGTRQRRLYLNNAAPVQDESGRIIAGVVAEMDLTERLQVERALRKSEERLGTFFASDMFGAFYWTDEGHITQANARFLQIVGYGQEDLQAGRLDWRDLTAPEYRAADEQAMRELRARGVAAPYEKECIRQDGSSIPVVFGAAIVGEGLGVAFVLDITERRQAEAALRLSEARVRRKLESVLSPEGDLGVLELADLIDAPAMQKLMDEFYRVAPIPMSIIDVKGRVLVGVGWQEICTRFHRVHSETHQHCLESDTQLATGLGAGESRLYKCRNNLWDMATPIIVGGQHLGNIFTGQFFFTDETVDREYFRQQARRYEFNEEEYLAALDRVPRFSRETIAQAMEFFIRLAGMLSQLGFSNVKLARLLAERDRLADSLRRSEERFRVAQELSPDGFTILHPVRDGAGRVVDFEWVYQNAAIARLNGTYDREVVGRRILEIMPEHAATPFHAVYQEVADSGRHRVLEAPFQRAGESGAVWYRVAVVPMGEDLAVLAQDITERKRLEAELRAALTSAEQAKAAAEHANQAKDQFLAVLSHELRTPLTPVLAAVSLIKRRNDVPPQVLDHLEVIKRNVSVEARLIDDLLDLTRIVRGKVLLDKSSVSIGEVLDRVAEVCKPDIETKRLHFDMQVEAGPLQVCADASRLQQVFWNVVKNAVKFTPEDGCIGVHAFREERNVIVEVRDSGIGIEPEATAKIFDAFEQGDIRITSQFGGLGLGLAISRRLVEMQGGTISAHSSGRGHGALFRVVLPMIEEPRDEGRALHRAHNQHRRNGALRILLVEDHGDTAQLTQALLEGLGHKVKIAGDVAEALRAAAEEEFDLLISDLGLPDRSGLELIRDLRRTGSRLKAIALSGFGREEDVRRSIEAGFNEHLTKPVDFEVLEGAVTKLAGE